MADFTAQEGGAGESLLVETQQVANAVLEQLAEMSLDELNAALEAIRRRKVIEGMVTCVLTPDGALVSNHPGRKAEPPRTCDFCDQPRMHGSMYCERCAADLKESEEFSAVVRPSPPILPNLRAMREGAEFERAMADPNFAALQQQAISEAGQRASPVPVAAGMRGRPSEF
jgi:hypothetical protein